MTVPATYPFDVVFADTPLPAIDVLYILDDMLHMLADRDQIKAGDFSRAVIAQFLYNSPLLTPSSWRVLLGHMEIQLNVISWDHADRYREHISREATYMLHPVDESLHDIYQVIFIDGQWVTWTGTDKFMVLGTGELVDELPSPGLEQVAYNLTELSRREYQRCLRKMTTDKQASQSGSQTSKNVKKAQKTSDNL